MSVCTNQDTFNKAFRSAIKYNEKIDEKRERHRLRKMSGVICIYSVIHLIFLIWGIMLAFKSQPPKNRVIHMTLAIIFSPIYVLSYYLNMF